MDKFLKGQCTLWVGYEYPPEYAKNIVWLRMDKSGNIMNLFIKILDNWYPLGINDDSQNSFLTMSSEGIKNMITKGVVYIGEEKPVDKVLLWIRPASLELHFNFNDDYALLYKLARTINFTPHPSMHTEVPSVYAVIEALLIKIDKASIGLPNGVCGLNDDGFIDEKYLPLQRRGNMKMMGYWNAETNTPTLNFQVPQPEGSFYIVTKGGTQNNIKYYENDFILSLDGSWVRVAIYPDKGMDTKVDKVAGKELSSNDYTDVDKTKLDGIEAGAEVNKNDIIVEYTAEPTDPITNYTIDDHLDAESMNPIMNKAVALALNALPKLVTLTEAQYEALAVKDPNTYYYIIEE